ncbi:MAG: hypothetical protein H6R25_4301, partial [Proteobacteria bacterium]|nr:hypothetical protein [Pseudomonadota bacterium]
RLIYVLVKYASRSVPILSLVFSMGVTTILTEGAIPSPFISRMIWKPHIMRVSSKYILWLNIQYKT